MKNLTLPNLSLIVAMDKNTRIGNSQTNSMPWHIPSDLDYFKKVTLNKTVIQGYNTYQSILSQLGKPLPKRNNVVFTSRTIEDSSIQTINNVPMLLGLVNAIEDEVFVIGGSKLYETLIKYCNKLYITHIDNSFDGDVYFPHFDESEFELHSTYGIFDQHYLKFNTYVRSKEE